MPKNLTIEVPKGKLYYSRAVIQFILEGDLEPLKEFDPVLYETALKAREAACQITQIEVKEGG